jgi:hypothetical protein
MQLKLNKVITMQMMQHGDRNTSFQSQVGNANDAVTEQTGDNNMIQCKMEIIICQIFSNQVT